MRVTLFANFREHAGVKSFDLDLPAQVTIQQAVEAIVQRYPALRRHWLNEAGEIHAHVHIFVNGEEYLTLPEAERTPLQPQDSLDFFPPVAGGQA